VALSIVSVAHPQVDARRLLARQEKGGPACPQLKKGRRFHLLRYAGVISKFWENLK